MKVMLAAASALTLFAVAAPAMAQSLGEVRPYGSIGYTQYRIDEVENDFDVESSEIDFGAVTGRFGGKFNPYLGAEGEIQVGVNDAEETSQGFTVSAGINYAASVYAVGFVPLSPNADLLARVGVGVTEVEAEASGFGQSASETRSGATLAYGVGGQYFFDGVNGVRADYTRFDGEDDSAEADSVSINYVRKF
jgi:hypothetical protein